MANYKQVSYGSQGGDVTELQKLLNKNGYNLAEDGIFGSQTQKAVKDYQQKNNLAVDGIVGNNTWGALTKAQSGSSNATHTEAKAPTSDNVAAGGVNSDITAAGGEPPAKTPTTQYNSGFTYGDFAGNDDPVVNEAWNVLNQHQGSKPGEYSPVWQDEADAYLNQYQNRDHFSYDVNSDALYQQLKDQYVQLGQMASMDAMGQAAALTGGYVSSYGQAVGQQAYNLYMNQLNDIIPELYQMAHDRHTQEGQNMLDMYDLYMNKENYEYNKYQDALNNWYQEESLNYQKERDEVADKQWEKTYNLNLQNSYKSDNSGTKYRDLSIEDRATIQKDFDRAETPGDVNYYADLYKGMGYDPEIIKLMAQRAAARIAGGAAGTGAGPALRNGTSFGANVSLK